METGGKHLKQNNVHGHGSFNIKQSSLGHTFFKFVELHNQFILLTMFYISCNSIKIVGPHIIIK